MDLWHAQLCVRACIFVMTLYFEGRVVASIRYQTGGPDVSLQ